MSNDILKNDKDRLLRLLVSRALFKEKVTLSSGKTSDYYIDARRVTLSSEGAYLCAKIILELLRDENVAAVGGPTLGADPLLGAIGVLSHQLKRPLDTFIVRQAPKPYGKQQQVEGPLLKPGANVVLIDDVATTGKAFVQSLEVLGQMGIRASRAVCIVDREEGAREAVAAKGCELISLFKASDLLKA